MDSKLVQEAGSRHSTYGAAGAAQKPGIISRSSAKETAQKIKDGGTLSKPVIACVTFLLVTPLLALGIVLAWYSSKVPGKCNTGLRSVFIGLAFLYITTSICLGCSTGCIANAAMDFIVHRMLANRYREANMTEEAEEANHDASVDMLRSTVSLPYSCLAAVCFLILCGFWIYGCIAALLAKRDCGSAPTAFWIILAVLAVCTCGIMPCIVKCFMHALIEWADKAEEADDPEICAA